MFLAILAGALVLALAMLFLSPSGGDELTEAEVEALVRAGPPPPSAATQPASRLSTLRLTTEPAGATVLLDGEPTGRTPLDLGDLRPDFYTITLLLPHHASVDTTVFLAGSTVSALRFSMRSLVPAEALPEPPAAAAGPPLLTDATPVEPVPARPSPPAAQVTRRGTPSGGGTVQPRAVQPRAVQPRAVQPRAVQPRAAKPATPAPPTFASADPEVVRRVSHTGSLSVHSTPTGADVLVDGVRRGRTPLSLSGLRPGSYAVKLVLPDRPPLSYQTDVMAQAVSVVRGTFPSR